MPSQAPLSAKPWTKKSWRRNLKLCSRRHWTRRCSSRVLYLFRYHQPSTDYPAWETNTVRTVRHWLALFLQLTYFDSPTSRRRRRGGTSKVAGRDGHVRSIVLGYFIQIVCVTTDHSIIICERSASYVSQRRRFEARLQITSGHKRWSSIMTEIARGPLNSPYFSLTVYSSLV